MPRKSVVEVAVRAVRRQGSLRAARRGEVLPRLLGQEDRRRGNRRARVRAEALHPRAQRREIPDLPLDAEAPVRPADRRRRRVRSVPDADALSRISGGTSRPITSKATPKDGCSRSSSSTSSPPRSSSRGAAASGTWRSSGRSTRNRRTGTGKCSFDIMPGTEFPHIRRTVIKERIYDSRALCFRRDARRRRPRRRLRARRRPRLPPISNRFSQARSSRRRSAARPTSSSPSR